MLQIRWLHTLSRLSQVFARNQSFTNENKHRRGLAATLVVLLLAVELIAAAHVHRWAWADSYSNAAQLSTGEAACPLCLFHARTPVSIAGGPVLAKPLSAHRFSVTALAARLLCAPLLHRFGRAPPAAV
jgi:hypothetical protein